MFNVKLGQAIPANPDRIMKYVSQAAEVQGLQVELLYEDEKNFRVVQYTGSDVSAIELEEFTEVKFFKQYWFSDSKYECGMWLDVREDIAKDDWSTMCLINGKYWCYAWAYFDAEYKINFDIKPIFNSSTFSFEDMEKIENQLLARAS